MMSSTLRVAVVGSGAGDAYKMRAAIPAQLAGWELVPVGQATRIKHQSYDVVIFVKSGINPMQADCLRRMAKYVVYDPLDGWSQDDPNPTEFFSSMGDMIKPDLWLATSPSCQQEIQKAVPGSSVAMLPHPCDRRSTEFRYDPAGPVIYSGDPRYLGSFQSAIEFSCNFTGRQFICRPDPMLHVGASLALALRLPPTDTQINRLCKPQAKVENAIAGGIPVLASHHECTLSLYPSITTIKWDRNTTNSHFVDAMDAALSNKSLLSNIPMTQDRYAAELALLIENTFGTI
jgi:hypothetical protein